MAAVSDQAIVLRLADYSETSQIATFFTAAHGLVRVIAKGAKRSTKSRISPGLDLLERIEATWIPQRGDAQLGTLTEWRQLDAWSALRHDALRLYSGLYAIELVAAVNVESDPHPGLFQALVELLASLAAGELPAQRIVWFQGELLSAIGLSPNLDVCVECGRPPQPDAAAWFSARAGGLLCRDCEMHHAQKRPLPALAALPRAAAGVEPLRSPAQATAARVALLAWFDLFDEHLSHIAGRAMHTAVILRGELRRN